MGRRITCADELTISQVSETRDTIIGAMGECKELTVDMSNVRFVDISAIQLLIASKKEAEHKGFRLSFMMSDTVKHISSSLGVEL